jgi:tetratricopeptide (TPR) repeat protein
MGGDIERVREQLSLAVAELAQVGARRAEAIALANLGRIDLDDGRLESAKEASTRAAAIQRELGNPRSEAIATMTLGLAALLQGRFAESRQALDAAHRAFQEMSRARERAQTLTLLAAVSTALGEAEEAPRLFAEAVALVRPLEMPPALEEIEAEQALSAVQLGAAPGLDELARLARRTSGGYRALLEAAAAESALSLGRVEEAQRWIAGALDHLQGPFARRARQLVLGSAARVALAAGDLPRARQAAEEAVAALRATGERYDLGRVLVVLGAVLRASGDPGSAEAALREARDLARELGVGPRSPLSRDLDAS